MFELGDTVELIRANAYHRELNLSNGDHFTVVGSEDNGRVINLTREGEAEPVQSRRQHRPYRFAYDFFKLIDAKHPNY